MQYKQKLLSAMIMAACTNGISTQAYAALAPNAVLQFDAGVTSAYGKVTAGSYFGMDTSGDGVVKAKERTAIAQNNGLILGTVQDASGSHSLAADGTESPDIDAPWGFFGNTGMHYTLSVADITNDDLAGNVKLDFSGWGVTWNGIARIDMSSGAWAGNADGVAIMTCAVDCTPGDTYTLDYSATVPAGDPSGFGNVAYNLQMVGTIPNLAPVATDDTVTVNEDSSGNPINVLGNDTDGSTGNTEGQSRSVTAVGSASKGTATLEADGSVTYTPTAGATGSDSFTYIMSDGFTATDSNGNPVPTVNQDGSAGTNTATATVNITINAKPVANNTSASLAPNSTITIDLSGKISDADGAIDATTCAVSYSGSANITDNGDCTFDYQDTGGVDTTDSFTYTVQDNLGAVSDPATVSLNIVTGNQPPSANDVTASTARDTDVTISLDATDDVGVDFNSVTINYTGSGSITDNKDGTVTYSPATGFAGNDSFTYTVNDTDTTPLASNVATVSITVINESPVATDDTATTALDTDTDIAVTANDTDDAGFASVEVISDASNGSTSINGLVITYSPTTGYSGSDNFTYRVTDTDGAVSNTATVNINVEVPADSVATIPPTSVVTAGANSTTPTGLTVADVGVDKNMSSQCIGGCIDFSMSNLGGSTTGSIVVQLSEAIPANAIYRKLKDGIWRNFESDSNNFVQSAPLSGTNCPGASSTAYTNGLTEGNQCLKVTIEDNGANDTDATVGTIADPSGVAVAAPIVGYTDGCSMSTTPVNANERADWWLVAGFMGLLGWLRLKRKKA